MAELTSVDVSAPHNSTRRRMLDGANSLAKSAIIQAAVALGIAGLGRIIFNSLLGWQYGAELFASYARLGSGGLLLGSLAAAGPTAAVTIGVARDWHVDRSVPRASGSSLAVLTLVMSTVVIAVGARQLGTSSSERLLIATLAIAVTLYQVTRAFGYAIDRAALVTRLELVAAVVPLLILAASRLWSTTLTAVDAVTIYLIGPAIFAAATMIYALHRVPWNHRALAADTRRKLVRIALVFFIGAGSAAALQYVPTLLSARTLDVGVTSVLFGAVQATAPLLLFSRVYATIQMPRIAGGVARSRFADHDEIANELFLPSLAFALGLAPWVVLSLGVPLSPLVVSTAALVSLGTLLQVWSTPAVTRLSADGRELIPALASVCGLIAASVVWWVGAAVALPLAFPLGLALGAAFRSCLPAWMADGFPLGQFNSASTLRAAVAVASALSLVAASLASDRLSLLGGFVLMLAGAIGTAWVLRSRAISSRENPPR